MMIRGMGGSMEPSEKFRLLFDALSKRSLTELTKAAYAIMDMPIVVADAAFVVVAKYPLEALGDEQWDANTINMQIEPRFLDTFVEDNHFAAHSKTNRPILIDWGHYEKTPRLTAVIKSGDMISGFISALTMGKRDTPEHYEDMATIAQAYSILFRMNQQSRSAVSDVLPGYLLCLLQGTPLQEENIHVIDSVFSDALRPPYVLGAIQPKDPYNAPLEAYFGFELERRVDSIVQTVYGETLYVLMGNVHADEETSKRMRLIELSLEENNLIGGFSRRFESTYPVLNYKWQADASLRIGSALDSPDHIFNYDDHLMDIILGAVLHNIPAENLEFLPLVTLRAYDRENSSDLLKTLYVYVSSGFDKKATAKELFIHRNTLTYRLDKIEEVAHIKANDIDLAFFLSIDSHMAEITRAAGDEAMQRGAASSFGRMLRDETSDCDT